MQEPGCCQRLRPDLLGVLPLQEPFPQDVPCRHPPWALTVCPRFSLSARPPPTPFPSILMYELTLGQPSPPLCPRRDCSVRGREKGFLVSVCEFSSPKSGISSLCHCSPSQGHRDAPAIHCALGPLGPTLQLCVPPQLGHLQILRHMRAPRSLFWPDCPWQGVCLWRWLLASVSALPWGLDPRAAGDCGRWPQGARSLAWAWGTEKCTCREP